MTDEKRSLSRRQLLRGAGGLTLGLPLLPSLLPTRAEAAATGVRPRLALFSQKQGGYWKYLNPPDAYATERLDIVPGHSIRWAPLRATPQSPGKIGISRIIQADPTTLTDRLLGKINLLRGIDHPNSRGHNRNAFGNTRCDEYPDDDVPSVDQLAAFSPSFYAPGEYRVRSIATGGSGESRAATGSVDYIPDPQKLFDRLFMGVQPSTAAPSAPAPPPSPERTVLVDALFDSYKQLRDGDRRLSSGDRRRLDDHMDLIGDLQKKVAAAPVVRAGACTPPTRPMSYPFSGGGDRLRDLATSKRLFHVYNDLIVAAFVCGVTRVSAVIPKDDYDPFSDYTGGWHELAHATDKADPMPALVYADATQAFFEHVLLDLATKLDAIEEIPGSTYLDNTLIYYTQEAAWDAHTQIDKVVLSIGNLNGFFKTGHFVDFRNLDRPEANVDVAGAIDKTFFFAGVPVQQWWGNVVQALGIPKSEWAPLAKGTGNGYGVQRALTSHGNQNKSLANAYLPATWANTGNKLPVIT